MFNFAWSEMAVIAVVALIAIGPKDMPAAIRGITDVIKKARRMASEFQGHVDDLMREADLGGVTDQIKSLRSFDVRGAVERAVDPDGKLRDSLSDPFAAASPTFPDTSATAVDSYATTEIARPEDADPVGGTILPTSEPPPFVPPVHADAAQPAGETPEVPAFVPPAHAAARLARSA